MGPDMCLTGETYLSPNRKNPAADLFENGYRLKGKLFDLGYWRKHPDLHGFIVTNFADGVDDCKPVPLCPESVQQIIAAIQRDQLPHTEGFFFGESDNDPEQKAEAIAIFSKALEWLHGENWARSVYYRACW